MTAPAWRTRPLWLGCALAGSALLAVTCTLPWLDTDFRLGAAIRVLMGAAGVAVLVLVARCPRRPSGGLVGSVGVLGACVLAYPSLLGLAAAGLPGAAGSVAGVAGAVGHVPALALLQIVPVLALGQATGRPVRGRVTVVVAVLLGSVLLSALGASAVGVLASVLWLGSFATAPVLTWTGALTTANQERPRAVVAALASMLPVVIIVWCQTLGLMSFVAGWSSDASATALMAGFATAGLSCGALALASMAPAESVLLAHRTVVGTLTVLLALITMIVLAAAVAGAAALQLRPGWAVVAGVAFSLVVGLVWRLLHRWTARVVDPAIELRRALAAAGPLEGRRRVVAQDALRRVTGDPALTLAFRVGDDQWLGSSSDASDEQPGTAGQDGTAPVVLAAADDGTPAVLARTTVPARLRRLGDCGALLHAAVLEAHAATSVQRAERAAERERSRLAQNLHDGLQGRMLGLALNLTLSGRRLDDPAARLLLDDAVDSLRDMVADVRALGGGALPGLLVDEGLRPALLALLRPLGAAVELDVPTRRLDPAVEETCYFVVSEAVANALKHAGADRVEIEVHADEAGGVQVSVRDDGAGGADPRLGSGLRGLAERVAAQGGVLLVRDGVPAGTVVEAVLPCAS